MTSFNYFLVIAKCRVGDTAERRDIMVKAPTKKMARLEAGRLLEREHYADFTFIDCQGVKPDAAETDD